MKLVISWDFLNKVERKHIPIFAEYTSNNKNIDKPYMNYNLQNTYYFFSFFIVFWLIIFTQYNRKTWNEIDQILLLLFVIFSFTIEHWKTIVFGFGILLWFYWNPWQDQKVEEIREEIERQNKREIDTKNREIIPRNIIQIWAINPDSPRIMSSHHTSLVEKWKIMNPEYRHIFMTEKTIVPFLQTHYPAYLETYNKLPRFIQKLDFFRYVALYHYGGFYFDVDMEPITPLDSSLLKHYAVFPIDQYVKVNNERMKWFHSNSQKFLLGQYAFGCREKDPFLYKIVQEIHENVDTYIEMVSKEEEYVYTTTGPDFITKLYRNYENKDEIYIIDNGREQCFGDYAIHQMLGSWK